MKVRRSRPPLIVGLILSLGLAVGCTGDGEEDQDLDAARARAIAMREEVAQGFRDLEQSVREFAWSGRADLFLRECDVASVHYRASFTLRSVLNDSAGELLDLTIAALRASGWTIGRNPTSDQEAEAERSGLGLSMSANKAYGYLVAILDGSCVEADEELATVLNDRPKTEHIWATPGVTRLVPPPKD